VAPLPILCYPEIDHRFNQSKLEMHRLSADNQYRPIIGQFADNRYRPQSASADYRHRPIIGIGRLFVLVSKTAKENP